MPQTAKVGTTNDSADGVLALASVALGVALLATNRWFPAVDDECAIINNATKPALETMRLYTHGVGQHEHPSLYDLLLHGWMVLTSAQMHLLRVPAIVFYVVGAFVLAKAGERLGGKGGQVGVFSVVAVWPFGFHFGRVAGWYSFSFFLVSLLTLAYLSYLKERTRRNWLWVLLCALALLYTSYFGWAILGCLGADLLYRERATVSRGFRPLLEWGALLALADVPLLRAFLWELHHGVKPSHSVLSIVFLGVYNLYCMFVSESVAPWFWYMGVPAGMAIALFLLGIILYGSPEANRFLLYFGCLLAVMTLLGIVETKRTLLIGAWLMLPIGVAIGESGEQPFRRVILASLLLTIAIGWFGIFYRKLYAAPHWVEPWPALAMEAADTVRQGGEVVGNNSSFFFYLTYALLPDNPPSDSHFRGLLPETIQRSSVYNPALWVAAGRPAGKTTLVVKGLNYPEPPNGIEEAMQWLDSRCRVLDEQQLVRDYGASLKQRFVPSLPQPEWRIQVKRYACP